jgi:hypothetical protein
VLAWQVMDILIENAGTFEYFTDNSKWTKKVIEARHFAGVATAFATAKREPIGKFNIVGYVAETRQLVNMEHGSGRGVQTATA